ncbi:hypothetical protein ACLQ3C_01130 [Gordonia sp. DT30]|uniref:hypothetical protein n=1 Tax=unclassified Gordonia (in: high G+C Gram-positive bacteria) TaxID=2657482 RepID=UPI003CF9CD5B
MSLFAQIAGAANKAVLPLLTVPVIGPALGRSMTVVTYTGRRSGSTFRLPVGYRREAGSETVVIGVALPDEKKWWRNFTGDGGPLSLTLGGATQQGHAIAHRDEKGRVTVRVDLGAGGERP